MPEMDGVEGSAENTDWSEPAQVRRAPKGKDEG
jgi:hypothetical protein